MAIDKAVDSAALDTSLTSIADAIREKTGSLEKLTPADMAAEISAMRTCDSTVQYSQMNDIVTAFISEVTYDPADYNSSQIANYAGQTTLYSKDKPAGVNINAAAGCLIVADTYSGVVIEAEAVDGDNTLYNLIPSDKGANYLLISDAEVKQSGHLLPTGQVRMIQCTTSNVRDLGGWVCDGGTVKYGKLFRGGEYQEADQYIYLKQLGIRHELNLRGTIEAESNRTSLRDYVRYTCPEKYVWYTIADTYKETWQEILQCVFDCVKHNEPLYFHCSAGADRTGTVACILEAILGMSQSDIDKDYELTCFNTGVATDNAARRRDESEWSGLITQINNLSGDTFRDKVINWVASMGFTADEINAYRAAMIDGSPETVTPSVETYSVTNNLANVTSDNAATTATQYQPYNANITPSEGYVINSVVITMGGTDITSTAFAGTTTALKYTIAKTLTNCTIDNSDGVANAGESYTATITAHDGYTLNGAVVTITMGGVDVSTYYSNGIISIPEVTGDIVIAISAVESAVETVAITWLNGYRCDYAVGSAVNPRNDTNYIISEPINVEQGKTYKFTFDCPKSDFGIYFIGVDNDDIVTEYELFAPGKPGETVIEWTPTDAATTKLRLRSYSSATEKLMAVTNLVVL